MNSSTTTILRQERLEVQKKESRVGHQEQSDNFDDAEERKGRQRVEVRLRLVPHAPREADAALRGGHLPSFRGRRRTQDYGG